jgi:hypothetical protein
MSFFQKLSQINKDIVLLESFGDFKAADVLHKKFIREAQNEVQPISYSTEDKKRGSIYKKRFNDKLNRGLLVKDENKDKFISSIYADSFFYDTDKKQLESLIRKTSKPAAQSGTTPSTVIPSLRSNQQQNFTELQTDLAKNYMAQLNSAKGEWDLDFIKMQYDRQGLPPFEAKILDDLIINIKKTKRDNLMSGLKSDLDAVNVTPGTNTEFINLDDSSIPDLQARIQHYRQKINKYKSTKDPAIKQNMLKYLIKFIKENYDKKLLDSKSYVTFMKELGINILT